MHLIVQQKVANQYKLPVENGTESGARSNTQEYRRRSKNFDPGCHCPHHENAENPKSHSIGVGSIASIELTVQAQSASYKGKSSMNKKNYLKKLLY
jgi:hypothetical protein